MYCIKCGVELADSEKKCPLCTTVVYHPDLPMPEAEGAYPKDKHPENGKKNSVWPAAVLSVAYLIPLVTVFMCDLHVNGGVTWSGYVMGALLLTYVMFILPRWFRNPNPVVFVPIFFAATGGYVLYIDLTLKGGWFLSFAFPVVTMLGVYITAVVALTRYLKRGKLFVFGGLFALLGVSVLPMEFLANYTFGVEKFMGWFVYPMTPLIVLGGFLIFLGIYRPARETMARLFYF